MKNYYFIVYSYSIGRSFGYANFGFVSDENRTFNNKTIKEEFIKLNPHVDPDNLVLINFVKFKNAKEYLEFFK